MSERRSNSREAVVKFLKERVESNPGISLQELTENLSQLPPDLRNEYGCSVKSLEAFLKRLPKEFFISKRRNVYVLTESQQATTSQTAIAESFVTPTSDRDKNGKDVTCLYDARGTIYRMFNVYGFISVEDPVKASVYFDVKSFENGEHKSLPSSKLQVGDSVILDAKLGPKDCEAMFRATRVTRATTTNLSSSPGLSPRSAKDEEMGDCGTFSHLVDQHGEIEFVKPSYGFIKFGPDESERAFFHVNKVDKSLGSWISNLADVFSVGRKVRFNAKLSTKPSEKVKWEATAVHLCRSPHHSGTSDSEDISGDGVFVSDDECDFQELLRSKLEDYQIRQAGLNGSAVGYGDSDEKPANADPSNSTSEGERSVSPLLPEWERRQKLSGERGFLYPVTDALGTIKFGPDCGLTAGAAVEVTYRDEEPINNFLWDVADGQEVSFNAVQAEDKTWIATRVWIGHKPTKPLVRDSEDVFTRITNKSMEAQKPLPNDDIDTRSNVGVEKALPNFGGSLHIQPSITTYKDVKGVIIQVTECIGTCEVKELAVSRKLKFTSAAFYKDGTMFLGYLNEVLRQGDTVFLDYMVGVSGRKEEIRCDLVWQGRRPREYRQISQEEFRQRLLKDTHNGENSFCFEDFDAETERADEAPRILSYVPLDTGLPRNTVPTMGSEASNSLSVTGLAALPAINSILTYVPVGGHNESSAWESAPDESLLLADVDDQALDRLANMTVAEITAQKESRRVAFNDVGVQAVDEDPLPPQHFAREGLVPALVNASTQTLSTGEIKSGQFFIS